MSESKMPIKGIRLEYRDVSGAGKQIFAYIGKKFNCVEFTLRSDVAQSIMKAIACEPWIQFSLKEWDDLLEEIFKEMVDLFNAKHSSERKEQ